MCNFIEWRADKKIVYKRYASLFFICCVDSTDNELITSAAGAPSLFFFYRTARLVVGRGPRRSPLLRARRRLEMIHLFVEVLDRYFGNVCELDIIFNFHKAYYILDELFIAGELEESSKKEVLSICAQMDEMMDDSKEEGNGKGGRK